MNEEELIREAMRAIGKKKTEIEKRTGGTMNVRHFRDDCYAVTVQDTDGPCVILWHDLRGNDTEISCNGYIVGGMLFAPSDGQGINPDDFNDDGTPALNAGWYDVATGQKAIVGISSVSPLSVIQ